MTHPIRRSFCFHFAAVLLLFGTIHGYFLPSARTSGWTNSFSRISSDVGRSALLPLAAESEPSSSSEDGDGSQKTNEGIDVSFDERLYRVRLSRTTGIDWGTDLSFSFVYVRDMDPSESAFLSGKVGKGDYVCELRPVYEDKDRKAEPVNLLGASFDSVMESFLQMDREVRKVDLVFFRGTKAELIALATGEEEKSGEMITITVIQNKGAPDETVRKLVVPAGSNVRQACVDNGINVYQSLTRWTNCKGKQLCGTCIINVPEGAPNTNRKSMDEESTLRENPDSYRLSCVTFAYGDVTVETFPPVNAAQWTR